MNKNDAAAKKAGFFFDERHPEFVRQFFRRFIRHTTGKWAGQPFELLDWQYENVVRPLFGWVNDKGHRRFRHGYISTAKKNGKTTLLAGLLLELLTSDNEPSAEIYSAATDKAQAGIMFTEAAKMVRANPDLNASVMIRDSTKVMVAPDNSRYKVLANDAKRLDGLNPHGVLVDELHCLEGRELWDRLRYGGSAREQPLMLAITTAGGDLESICGEQYTYAKKVLADEIIDPHFFAYIAEAALEDDWTKEETWKKANPSYGVTLNPADFRADFNEAVQVPVKENAFRRFRLNQWTQTAAAWLSMHQWDACKLKDYDPESTRGNTAYAGLDLSQVEDTTAFVALVPTETGYQMVTRFWLPEDNIQELEKRHKVPYRTWAKQGIITLTPGNTVDYKTVRRDVLVFANEWDLKRLAIDRKFQGQQLESELIEDGLTVHPAGQGWVEQDLPLKEIERLLKAGRLWHDGNPLLRWHASNAVVEIDKNNNYTLHRKKSRSKIDGIAALAMAMYLAMSPEDGDSVYNSRGITYI